MATAHGATPPLAEAGHRSVVPRHVVGDAPYARAARADTQAQLGLLAGDQAFAKAADSGEHVTAHHCDAATRISLADRAIPLHVAQAVVNRSLRKALAQT